MKKHYMVYILSALLLAGCAQGGQPAPRTGQYAPRDGQGQGGYTRQGGQYGNRDGQGQGGYNRQGGQ